MVALGGRLAAVTDTLRNPAPRSRSRHLARLGAVTGGVVATTLVSAVAALPASAAPNGWEEIPPVDGLQALVVFVLAPLAVIAVIVLLVMLPSLSSGQKEGALTFAGEPEWFGGPRKGADALPADTGTEEQSEKGGASGTW